MKAVVCRSYGPPEVLRLEEVGEPTPKPGEVRIRVWASAVTSSDCYVRGLNLPFRYRALARLALGMTGPRRPVLGMVLAGEVDALGQGVASFKVGDQVFGLDRRRFGTYAEEVCWPEATVLALRPEGLSWEEAAALPYGGLLALHYLRIAGLARGRRALVYGASGAVGTSAVQLARHFGAEVTGVCSAANAELVKSLGASAVVDYRTEDFTAWGEHYDVIFDAVGKRKSSAALRHAHKALAPGGRVVSVDDGTPRLLATDLVLLGQLAEAGEIKPVIDRCYALEDIVEAHRYVDQGHKRGNVVVAVASQKPPRSS
jgi:NADPH:quinone reductase-like Zn-dependent oxidoreductase